MRRAFLQFAVLLTSVASFAQNGRAFWIASGVNFAAIAADSQTTGRIRARWLATPATETKPCLSEAGEPWLYGEHPGYARAYEVGALKFAASEILMLALRRSRWRSLWMAPLVYTVGASAHGAIHNAFACY